MEIREALFEKREALLKDEQEEVQWAKEQGIFYAFNREGRMLTVRKKSLFQTKAGKVIWPEDSDGVRRENLSEDRQERIVLNFIGSGAPSGAGFKAEVPMPSGFTVKEITCQDDIFTIWPEAGQEPVSGTYNVMREALTLVESMYSSADGVGEDVIDRCFYDFLAEDHQNYLKKVELEKRTSAARGSRSAKKENFYRDEKGNYVCEYTTRLWGGKADISATCEGKVQCMDKKLGSLSKQLNQHIKWIDKNKESIQKAILEDDMVELACQWMEGCELVEADGKICYELADGRRLPAPVTEEAFLNSLYVEGVDVNCSEEEFLFDIFIGTEPDFFACHSIEVFITVTPDNGYKINVNGLAG